MVRVQTPRIGRLYWKELYLVILVAVVLGLVLVTFLNITYDTETMPLSHPSLVSIATNAETQERIRPCVNDMLRRLNYRGAVEASRGGSTVHDLFNPDVEAIRFDGRIHPTHKVVIDVGAFDGMDIAYPAYRNGYTVVAFELATGTQNNIISNWEKEGLVRDKDFKIVNVADFVDKVEKTKSSTMFLPLEDPSSVRLFLVCAGASDQTARISVKGSGTTTEVDTSSKGNNFLIEIDRIISPKTKIFLLKTDAEGHDGKALIGSKNLLAKGQVYTVTLEFRPKALREHGTDPVELLTWLWDNMYQCYDMNTHPGYEPVGIPPERRGLGRGSYVEDFVAWLDAVPATVGPAGDELGGWEDLICSRRVE